MFAFGAGKNCPTMVGSVELGRVTVESLFRYRDTRSQWGRAAGEDSGIVGFVVPINREGSVWGLISLIPIQRDYSKRSPAHECCLPLGIEGQLALAGSERSIPWGVSRVGHFLLFMGYGVVFVSFQPASRGHHPRTLSRPHPPVPLPSRTNTESSNAFASQLSSIPSPTPPTPLTLTSRVTRPPRTAFYSQPHNRLHTALASPTPPPRDVLPPKNPPRFSAEISASTSSPYSSPDLCPISKF